MEFFRNPEIKHAIYGFAGCAVILGAAGYFISGIIAAVFAAAGCAAGGVLFILFTRRRYKKIYELCALTDEVLHGKERVDFSQYSEGELSVLKNELCKMTEALADRSDRLKKEKSNLTDSIADISHQLRTPLTSMNLILAELSRRGVTDVKRAELTHQLKGFVSHIDFLVAALLKMSRLDAGTVRFKKEKVVLREVLSHAEKSIAVPMDIKNQSFVTVCSGDESFSGDAAWTTEAVGNIVKNCMEHSPVGGEIRAECSENALYTSLVITDNGEGFDEADLPHLFERFYKGKNSSGQSIGIGLALSRSIIAAQNGTVRARNIKPHGACFEIRFYKSAV